jgi:hypothetical protein
MTRSYSGVHRLGLILATGLRVRQQVTAPGPPNTTPRFWTVSLEQTERNESGAPNRRLAAMTALLPSVPEIRYLLARLLLAPPVTATFVLSWSIWRRRHQLGAAEAHYRRHQVQL